MIKFQPKFINVTVWPILIIGEKPGKTRDGSTFSLQGNRTGDYVHEAIQGLDNIILTNVTNYLYEGPLKKDTTLGDGILDLIELIETYKPSKIITLGGIAREYARSIANDHTIVSLPHPSFVNRFHFSEREMYLKQFKDELNKRVPADQGLG